MLNRVTIMGRLGADPELRQTKGGTAVCSLRIACDRDFKTEDGERETDWIDVVAWRSTAEFVAKYFSKGSAVIVDGRLQTRTWEDDDGNKRKAVEVVADNIYFADSKKAAPKKAEPEDADPGFPDEEE
ncbi:MAG: single-stranded DNA-binding protein [Oscillibacter sp.]|nr:single-stranded DNA-binding protein [Oscillibacter sp.]